MLNTDPKVESRALTILKSYKVHTIFWLCITALDWSEWLILQQMNNGDVVKNFRFAVLYTAWPFWILFGPLVVKYSSNYPFQHGQIARNIFRHILFGLFVIFSFTILQTVIMATGSYLFFDIKETIHALSQHLLYTFNLRLFTYFFIVAVTQCVAYFDTVQRIEIQNSKLQAQLADAKLKTLHMQIQPHFLFNTHQAIAGLMLKNQTEKASEMLSGLSALLRQTLLVQQEPFIPLKQELAIVKEYLNIQQIRFHDRLVVSIAEPTHLLDARVPPFILQPLIENAIKHGFAPYSDSGLIEVNVFQEGERLLITIRDDGGGIKRSRGRNGIGLENIRARLREHYGDDYSLTLENHAVKGAVATLALPLKILRDEHIRSQELHHKQLYQ